MAVRSNGLMIISVARQNVLQCRIYTDKLTKLSFGIKLKLYISLGIQEFTWIILKRLKSRIYACFSRPSLED